MKLNEIFQNGMVLAANKPIRVFGEGSGDGEVRFLNAVRTWHAENGKWCVELPAMPMGGPYEMEIMLNGERTVLTDIYLGEVILLHGQSNIQYKLRESNYPVEKYESCELVRLFTKKEMFGCEYYTAENGWVRCTASEAGHFSAIGYHVALRLAKEKGCAVGLIACSMGASVIESWMPEGVYEEMGIHLSPDEIHRDHFRPEGTVSFNEKGFLYHYLVEEIMPYSLTQVIWYQGESNATPAEGALHERLLARLIAERRRDFADETLPFTVVQLADTESRMGLGWTLVQEAQLRVGETVPNVTTVICRDVCERDNIHPPTKDLLSERIARAILAQK